MSADTIQQARDVLAQWRAASEAVTGDRAWDLIPKRDGRAAVGTIDRNGEPSYASILHCELEGHPQATYIEHDADDLFDTAEARLIVGTAGSPELLDAIDGLLSLYGTLIPGSNAKQTTERIAAAILSADERMSA